MLKFDLHTIKNLKRQKNVRGPLYAFGLSIFLIIILLIIHEFQHKRLHQEYLNQESMERREMVTAIEQETLLVHSDLAYFSSSSLARALLQNGGDKEKKHLTDLMINISTTQNRYDQIRILDATGQEIIRVNRQPKGEPLVVPQSQLQNKAERYYFSETSTLLENQIYTSPFDLNMENGVFEQPIKPVIRFATPIYSETGTLLGVGVINYLGQHLLGKLQQIRSQHGESFYLLNNQGYYLKGPESAMEWCFLLMDDVAPKFPRHHPKAWRAMNCQQQGNIITDAGLFFFERIRLSSNPPLDKVQDPSILLILFASEETLIQKEKQSLFNFSTAVLLLVPFFAFIGWMLGSYQVRQKHLFTVLEHEASHDPLTDLYNRKAICDILKQSVALSHRRQAPLAVGYLDIDGLKEMNDSMGHDAGDKMIRSAATAITTIIRDTDSAARVGGDEFMIIFPDCTADNARVVLERIKLHFADQGLAAAEQKWWISGGCAELLPGEQNADKMVERADKMMYRDKQLPKDCENQGKTSSISARS